MDDYIKRENAKRAVWGCTRDTGIDEAPFEYAEGLLEDVPSEDVAPVRHGHWDVREPMPMHDIKGNLSWGNWYVCTGCGFATTAIEGHITQYRYCPNCGARMDGEDDEL